MPYRLYEEKAVVLFSGGQDSTICLGAALKRHEEVVALTIDYEQRHKIEIEVARQIVELYRRKFVGMAVDHKIIKLDVFSQLTANALTSITKFETNQETGLPTSFVPGRNILFIALASMVAYQVRAQYIYIGVSAVDYSGYPDCREETINPLGIVLRKGLGLPDLQLVAPLMRMSKVEEWKWAYQMGILSIVEQSHSCYNGVRGGCGECPACKLRKESYSTFRNGLAMQ